MTAQIWIADGIAPVDVEFLSSSWCDICDGDNVRRLRDRASDYQREPLRHRLATFGATSDVLELRYESDISDRHTPRLGNAPSPNTRSLRNAFTQLVENWRRQTDFLSDVLLITSHPSYLRIIGLGPDALPLIFEQLDHEADLWHVALEAIIGEGPDPAEFKGNLSVMRERWLTWGAERGYVT